MELQMRTEYVAPGEINDVRVRVVCAVNPIAFHLNNIQAWEYWHYVFIIAVIDLQCVIFIWVLIASWSCNWSFGNGRRTGFVAWK